MRILIVEDDPTIAQAIADGLQQETFAVDVVHDGEEGYNAARHDEYDLLILDVMLPSMPGTTIARRLRSEGCHTRILMLSARDQISDRVRGLDVGADDYMVKPFSFEELLARIRALLRRPDESMSNTLKAHGLVMDIATHDISRYGRPITLSAKEFAILEYLLRNKGRVLSKNNIVMHVWNFDADVLPHTVEAFIAYVRAKIDKPFPDKPAIIRTVRGFGYTVKETV